MSAKASTICAVATPPGRAGIAVVRISGPDARAAVEQLIGDIPLEPRKAALCRITDPKTAELLDRGLVLWFPAPASFTGEDVVELQLHGGRAVTAGVIETLLDGGLRLAEPGEFTRRAFETGKLDLAEVEALADLIAAETSGQRRQALSQLAGRLGRQTEDWRTRLIHASAVVEAAIDFPDEDLPEETFARAAPSISAVLKEIEAALADESAGERLREGLSVAIIGAPNAGKSTLLNALARREVAIVSSEAGTTRDVIEVALDLGGVPVTLIDTAGLREAEGAVEQEGIRRARQRAETADLRLVLWDSTQGPARWQSLGIAAQKGDLLVFAKSDIGKVGLGETGWPGASLAVSAKTGAGMEALMRAVRAQAERLAGTGEAALITRARHRHELSAAAEALKAALAADPAHPELLAEELRRAGQALGRVAGRIDVEDVLDGIFAEFCIGK